MARSMTFGRAPFQTIRARQFRDLPWFYKTTISGAPKSEEMRSRALLLVGDDSFERITIGALPGFRPTLVGKQKRGPWDDMWVARFMTSHTEVTVCLRCSRPAQPRAHSGRGEGRFGGRVSNPIRGASYGPRTEPKPTPTATKEKCSRSGK